LRTLYTEQVLVVHIHLLSYEQTYRYKVEPLFIRLTVQALFTLLWEHAAIVWQHGTLELFKLIFM